MKKILVVSLVLNVLLVALLYFTAGAEIAKGDKLRIAEMAIQKTDCEECKEIMQEVASLEDWKEINDIKWNMLAGMPLILNKVAEYKAYKNQMSLL
jgi:uncharacterized membrane protein YccF (DUF307 family)